MSDFRDRPSMLDAFGARLPLFPAEAKGRWRNRRTLVHAVLMVVFLILPWITLNGAPAVLVDLENRRFAFFGLKFWAHDGPLLFLVLGILTLSLALVTALFGRAWCGWACPQTVFLDGFIRRIEKLVEGSHLKRRELAAAPMSFSKLAKKIIKWTLFAVFTGVLTHSFLAYFFGADRVLAMMTKAPSENPGAFLFVLSLNALMLFDLAWFREQFCLIVCPYGRIQSMLMDSHSVTVQYDVARGEPRKAKGLADHGACVACNRCVSVCPTGIDIRNGIQMECIACTACIDACDDVMRKTNQPEGLIRYAAATKGPVRWFRSRVVLYLGILGVMVVALGVSVGGRRELDLTVLRALDVPYFLRTDEQGRALVVNSYRIHVHNRADSARTVPLELMEAPEGARLSAPEAMLSLKSDDFRMVPFVVEIPQASLSGASTTLKLRAGEDVTEVQFVSP